MITEAIATQERAGRKEWIALAVLILPLLLVSMDVSVLYFAVPFIVKDLSPSATQQLWIFDIYGFVLAGFLLTMGALGDRIGRRRLLLIGAVAFSAASTLAAYAPNAEMLIAARAVLGIAGATLMPSTMALIRNMFHNDQERSKAIAIWTAVMTGGIALGPIISGALLEHFWWGSVFLINLPAMAILVVLGPILLPEYRTAAANRFDWISSLLSLGAVMPIIYGIKEWAANGYTLPRLLCLIVGVAIGGVFARRQYRVADSVLDVSLFSRIFSTSLVAQAIAMFALVGNAIFMTQYLQSVLGMSPLRGALWALVPSVVVGGAAPMAAALAQKVGRSTVVAAGFLLAAVGFAVVTQVHAHSPLILALIGMGVLSAGLVMVMTLITDMALGAIRPESAGAAAATLETTQEFGGALGMAILGSIGAAVYGSRVSAAIPVNLSSNAAHTIHETLGGATAIAATLPHSAGASVLAAARDAFTAGMNVEASVGCALMVAAAVMAFTLMREPAKSPAPIPAPALA